ncbi:Mur ligase family protein [Staphylococcus debuckii]|uniref:Mur ligase family protein n=1 Tax=Staphylococcus debuckii TaxID=2044912 RepID=A0ABU9EV23_9STAP
MYTLGLIADILDAELLDAKGKENNIISDFEYQMLHVKSSHTAFISISKLSWQKYLNKSKVMNDGNSQIPKNIKNIGLIITESYVEGLENKIPQIIVNNSIKAMKILALYIRKHFSNPVICLTGSMGKSSTRLMLTAALSPLDVQENRGNSNTRSAIYLHMCKLASNPDIAIFETSLNALNNRGNMALVLKPNIAIVTGIGSAHLSTIGSTEEIAKFKARIFAGLNKDGIAIYNADTLHHDYLRKTALKFTSNVYGYSTKNPKADLFAESITPIKKAAEVKTNDGIHFTLPSVSNGMVENALAVLLSLKYLDTNIEENLENLRHTQLFKKVLEFKDIHSATEDATLLDDTHNASLPAMINAIQAFNSQSPFFQGHKIIALGQISDLGDKTDKVHAELVPILEKSKADYILCMDEPLRKVVNKVKGKHITWYRNPQLLLHDLCFLINQDALVLMKSSVTKTDFPKIAQKLSPSLLHYRRSGEAEKLYEEVVNKGKAYLVYNLKTKEIEEENNRAGSATIEGLSPLLYYIDAKTRKKENYLVTMKEWPTNNKEFFTGRKISFTDLIETMKAIPHPSLVYQLAYELYPNNRQRKNYVEKVISNLGLSDSSAINLTGRYRTKERQTFSVDDLLKLVKEYKSILLENDKFVIGNYNHHGFFKTRNKIVLFTGFKDIE